MRTLVYKPKYQNWRNVTGTTVPGRCYSISELLMRTVRNQPLPIMNTYQEKDDGRNSDKDIDEDIKKAVRHPRFDHDFDEADAFMYLKKDENEEID